jgi:hypothetical protein
LVVLKEAGSDGGGDAARQGEEQTNLFNNALQREKGTKGVREGAVLSFEGQLGDERLQLGLPDQGAAAEQENVPSWRSYSIF